MCLPLGPADSSDVPILPACPARHPAEGKSARVVAEALAGLQVKGGPVARMRVLYEVGGWLRVCLVFWGCCRGRQQSSSACQLSTGKRHFRDSPLPKVCRCIDALPPLLLACSSTPLPLLTLCLSRSL